MQAFIQCSCWPLFPADKMGRGNSLLFPEQTVSTKETVRGEEIEPRVAELGHNGGFSGSKVCTLKSSSLYFSITCCLLEVISNCSGRENPVPSAPRVLVKRA